MTQQQLGGLDYNIDARSGKYKLSGNAQVKHADNTIVNNTNRTNFLANGDTYDRMVANNRITILRSPPIISFILSLRMPT